MEFRIKREVLEYDIDDSKSRLELSLARKACVKILSETDVARKAISGRVGNGSTLALFDMPNSNRFDILSISIFTEISLSISIFS